VFLWAVVFFLLARHVARGVALLVCATFGLGLLRTAIFLQKPAQDASQFAEGKHVKLSGRVASDPEGLGDRTRFVLDTTNIETYRGKYSTRGRVMVTLYERFDRKNHLIPSFGDIISVRGRFRTPTAPSNPGAPDYSAFLARQRIWSTLTGDVGEMSFANSRKLSVQWLAFRFKSSIASKVLKIMPETEARLIIAILFGNYAILPIEVQASFMRSGTMHLLAASGYNCGLIIGIFGFLLVRLTIARSWRYWVLVLLIWLFTISAGAGPSIVRAALMVTTFMAAYLVWRVPDIPNSILLALLVICAWKPSSLYDIGLQLSFAAVISIVFIVPFLQPMILYFCNPEKAHAGSKHPGARVIFWTARAGMTAVALSIAASVGTLPIVAYYFNYISLVNIPANAVVSVLVGLLTAFAIATIGVGFALPFIVKPLALVTTTVASMILEFLRRITDHPWVILSVRSPSTYTILLYYVCLFVVLEYAHQKLRTQKRMACTS